MTSQYTFVRGLWGDPPDHKCPTETRAKVLNDIRGCAKRCKLREPLVVYVWGDENARFLRSQGIEYELVSREGIQNFTGGKRRHSWSKGRINWGLNMWRHKLECVVMALQTHRAVIWLDWDCHQIAKLPLSFWAEMALGEVFQASLRAYRRPQCPWRKGVNKHYVPHGAFMYFEQMSFVKKTIAAHQKRFPKCTDEIALAWVLDQMIGGWKGPEFYKLSGFEPHCYDQRKKYVFQPEVALFRNVGKR